MNFKKKNIIIILIIVVAIIILLSYILIKKVYSSNDLKELRYYSEKTFDIDKDNLPYDSEEIFDQLFDINNTVEINIEMSDDELKNMEKDCKKYKKINSKSPIYRKADLYVTIKNTKLNTIYTYKIEEVGVRQKGNTSYTCFHSTKNLKIDNLIHFKIDFQETFDDEKYYSKDIIHNWENDEDAKEKRKNRTFATLEKLDMKWNRNNDQTYIRDYYANEFYRNNGVLSGHSNLSSVNLSGLHLGIYTIYEPIDKIFIQKYLKKEDQGGDLYKCGNIDIDNLSNFTSESLIGIDDEDKALFFAYDKKTNKKVYVDGKVDHSTLENMIKVLNNEKVEKNNIEEVIDTEYFMKFAATSYFIGNPDDMRNNANNYYVYFKKSDNKAIFIPYDNDLSFGVIRLFFPKTDFMFSLSPFSGITVKDEKQINPIYIYTVLDGGYYINEYSIALKNVVNNEYLTSKKFDSVYEIAKNNYEDYSKLNVKFKNTKGYNFAFDNFKTNENITFLEFVYRIKRTYNLNVK